MRAQENRFARSKKLGMTMGSGPSRRVLAGLAAILIGASLIFSPRVSSHNIDLAKARDVAREYARKVRDESGGKYLHYSTSCKKAFPGHNHVAYCTIDYQNATDAEKGVYTCRETIQIFMWAHRSDGSYNFALLGSHRSGNVCGKIYLHETDMSLSGQ